jgi:hypothetical protein
MRLHTHFAACNIADSIRFSHTGLVLFCEVNCKLDTDSDCDLHILCLMTADQVKKALWNFICGKVILL